VEKEDPPRTSPPPRNSPPAHTSPPPSTSAVQTPGPAELIAPGVATTQEEPAPAPPPEKAAAPAPTDSARREWFEHPNVKKVLEKFNGDIKSVTPRKKT